MQGYWIGAQKDEQIMKSAIKALLAEFRKKQVDLASLIQELQDGMRPAPSLVDGLEKRPPSEQPWQTFKPELTGQALLDSQGFPKDIADAFDKAAQETNSVIMSRAPGKAVLSLVAHGHDLKCFQIKAKSCDWGPMSGFLCQLTCFNKKGTEKIDDNDVNYVKYFKFMRDKQVDDAEFKKAVQDGQTPFIPLQLFDARKQEVLRDIGVQKLFSNDVYGIASHTRKSGDGKEATVHMEFLLKKAGKDARGADLWAVYHGRVFFKKLNEEKKLDEAWSDFFEEKISYLKIEEDEHVIKSRKENQGMRVGDLIKAQPDGLVTKDEPLVVQASTEAKTFLDAEFKRLEITAGSAGDFYPLYVAQNPFPPFSLEKEKYKNAVTGDYDLFAVWPVRPDIGWEDLVRLSDLQIQWQDQLENKKKNKEGLARKEGFFLSVPAKPFALELRASPDVFIEVIPGFDELEQWEDPETGNINTAVSTAAQILNSFVYAHMLQVAGGSETEKNASPEEQAAHEKIRSSFSYANMAFHSDEGGRPGIDEIDLPVAVFLPESVAKMKSTKEWLAPFSLGGEFNRFLVIKEHEYDKFLRLSLALRHKCFEVFNHVWLTYLFALVITTAKNTEEISKYFKGIVKEKSELGPPMLDIIRMLLSALFVGGQLRVTFAPSSPWGVTAPEKPDEAAAAEQAMQELAEAFITAMGEKNAKDKRKTLKRAMIRIPARNTPSTVTKGETDDEH
jgi:hypothetical protein